MKEFIIVRDWDGDMLDHFSPTPDHTGEAVIINWAPERGKAHVYIDMEKAVEDFEALQAHGFWYMKRNPLTPELLPFDPYGNRLDDPDPGDINDVVHYGGFALEIRSIDPDEPVKGYRRQYPGTSPKAHQEESHD